MPKLHRIVFFVLQKYEYLLYDDMQVYIWNNNKNY